MRRRFLILSVLWLLLLPAVVLAHGGGTPQLVNEPAGPYWISVWTSPDPARVGQLHLTLGISEPGEGREAGAPLLGADVRVRLRPGASADAEPLVAVATNEQATNKLFYEADVTLPATGVWQVEIEVNGPEGQGSVTFPLPVEAAQTTNWFLLGGAGVIFVALLSIFFSRRHST